MLSSYKRHIFSLLLLCGLATSFQLRADKETASHIAQEERDTYKKLLDKIDESIDTLQLDNGMRIICVPQKYTNSVTVAMAYNVGAKHESVNEFGMAHIVEHMIFKGTTNRGEGDLDRMVRHLGGGAGAFNALTGPDNTYYYFNTDNAHWPHFVDTIADSAMNMDWDSSVLDSEIQAIFQEIKLGGQDQNGGLISILYSTQPQTHPYGHPVIGFKDQIFNFTREDVLAFYKKHYTPDNAVLLVVGDVEPIKVFERATKAFKEFRGESTRPEALQYPFYNNFSTLSQTVYHTQQYKMKSFIWHGARGNIGDGAALEYITEGLSRRLKQKWVDAKGWCLQTGVQYLALKDDALFLTIAVPVGEPKDDDGKDVDFQAELLKEINDIIENGLSGEEFAQAHKKFTQDLIGVAESVQGLSRGIACGLFPATNAQGWYDRLEALNEVTPELIKHAAYTYLRPFLMHQIERIPLPKEEVAGWQALQQETDAHEQKLLSSRVRTETSKEHGSDFVMPARTALEWPQDVAPHCSEVLSNGMMLHYVHNDVSPTVSCGLVLKDAESVGLAWGMLQKQHAASFWSKLVVHGTKSLSKKAFDDALSSLGATMAVSAGAIGVSAMRQDIAPALEIATKALTESFITKETPAEEIPGEQYPADLLERKKMEVAQMVQMSQNDPNYKFGQFLVDTVFDAYPWSYSEAEDLKHALATSLSDLESYHQLMTDPARVVCTVCGDIRFEDARALAEKHFVPALKGTAPTYVVPEVPALNHHTGTRHVELPTTEVAIRGICPTVTRDHKDFAVLVLLDTYMKQRVFDIRDATGLFYAGMSFLTPATTKKPALFGVGVQTGPTRVPEVIERLKQMLSDHARGGIAPEVFENLRTQWILSKSKYARTTSTVAASLSSAISQELPWNDKTLMRDRIQALTLADVNEALARHCNPDNWVFVTLGREATA